MKIHYSHGANMKRSVRLIIILSIATALSDSHATEAENTAFVWSNHYLQSAGSLAIPYSLSSTLRIHEGHAAIAFHFVNTSTHSLRTYPESLPWGNSSSIKLVAFRDDKQFLQNLYAINDPGPALPLVIKPGGVLDGQYDLAQGLVIHESDRSHNIIVLWSYAGSLIGQSSKIGTVAGVVVIPARK